MAEGRREGIGNTLATAIGVGGTRACIEVGQSHSLMAAMWMVAS